VSDEDEQSTQITLYCREGASDKVYQLDLAKQGKGWVVNVAYGRRGGTLTKDTKTPKPVPYDQADEIFGDLVVQKLNKGYQPGDAPASSAKKGAAKTKEPTWDHPKLGRFEHDGVAWTRTVKTPDFKPFRYEGSSTKCELGFETDDETEHPSRAAVAVAERVLANQAALAAKVAQALWDDFTGKGPDSSMYWHGDLDSLADGMEFEESLKPPKKAADVPRLMQLTNISVPKPRRGQDKPLAELSFAAAFEEEHGVGILTDGRTILGIGYSSDVSPFKKSKRKR